MSLGIKAMKISNLMTKKPTILVEKATALEAIKKMQRVGCGILPIGNDVSHIKGVVTDRDIMLRAVAKDKDLNKIPITEIMSKDVVFCEGEDLLQQAVYQMNQHNIRRVLVKDKSQALSGILSLGDIIRRVQDKALLASLFKETSVA